MPHTQLLIIDSRDRTGGNASDFFVNLRPGLQNVRSVRLLYADIPSLEGDTAPYYLIETSLGAHVRGASQGDSATFIVPRSAASGFRTFWAQNSQFPAVVFEEPSRSLSDLAVSVRVRGGGSAGLGTADWYMVLQLECD
jgi:hypothetical protein